MAGMVSMAPGVLLFGRIVKAGGGSKLAVVAGTALIALIFYLVSIVVARATLRLEPRN
jgi:hypothetical protein